MSINSPTDLLEQTSRGALLLKKESENTLSPSEKIELSALKTLYTELYTLYTQKALLIKQLADLQTIKNPTQVQQQQIIQLTSSITNLDSQIDSLSTSSADNLQKLLAQQNQTLLTRLKSEIDNSLAIPSPEDLFEFILRTEALNPYQRERQCDLDFLELLTHLGTETENIKTYLTSVAKNILSN